MLPIPAIADCDALEDAVEANSQATLVGLLDRRCKTWPQGKALAFAQLALRCKEERRRKRPALESVVLRELGRLEP